jgi:hypothetical protein
LSLDIDVRRIQWTVAPRIDPDNFPDQPPTLGQFVECSRWFGELMNNWLPDCPDINRIAFAAMLLQPVADREAAQVRLNQYLRSVEINPDWSDFQLRLNRRARSTVVEGLDINRLCTWSAAATSVELRAQTVEAGGVDDRRVDRVEADFCSVELDINTAVPRDSLPRESLPDLLSELIDLGTRVASSGDQELCR